MTASWASVLIAAIALLASLIALVWRDGRRDGRTDAVLERLTDIIEDHEDRLRWQEQISRPPYAVPEPAAPRPRPPRSPGRTRHTPR